MEAATESKRAEGVATPTAYDSHRCASNSARPQPNKQVSGAGTLLAFNGTALRHLREAQSIALRHGLCARAGRELRAAREAVDSGIWLCDYTEADR